MPELLTSRPATDTGLPHLLLAHGASQPMTSPFFETLVAMLSERGLVVTRFEFAYMAARRTGAKRRPPPPVETLFPEFHAAISATRAAIGATRPLIIGGKSMGGRIASLIADDLTRDRAIAGLVCLGYPFHPPKEPGTLRTAHLAGLATPTLIAQGERDPFGTREDVAGYDLSPAIAVHWVGDGDHDFGPRGRSGFTRKGNLAAASDAIVAFAANLSI
ncbi:MAG: alpha/beta family hydrolase [Hyphomicrobiaceae bacterium]|nr:alpha/beta family hydrolase [Hyphomicrobiaceae bacterium]